MIKPIQTDKDAGRLATHYRFKGMTMIELLVVITVIMLLAAVMIPTVRYQYRNRALREADRQLNAFIGSAQSRAQQLGRPVGIWIDRFRNETIVPIQGARTELNQIAWPTDANYAVAVYIAEIPMPYSGDLRDSRVVLSNTGTNWQLNFPLTSVLQNPNNPLIRRGDRFQIQLDRRGPYFEAQRLTTDVSSSPQYILIENSVGNGTRIPLAARTASGVAFQIQRRPTKSLVPPLRLPAGAVIDLSVSGMGSGGNEFLTSSAMGNQPVIIMFQPDGSIDRVLYNGVADHPIGWVHLLVGRQNQVFPGTQFIEESTEIGNVMDTENRWVSINHRTGAVTSEQVDSIARQTSSSDSVALKLTAARMLVRSGTGTGGN
ncbi:MAG: type II secretion system protein [Planctomycetota bacterium]|nr:type II secretion system protein [Planctomycetota bacterium]